MDLDLDRERERWRRRESMEKNKNQKKRKWMYSLARKEAEKEATLYRETVYFVCHYYGCYTHENQEERKLLKLVSSNMIDIYTDFYNNVFFPPMSKPSSKVKFNEDDISAVIKEYRQKIEIELNYFYENMIHVDTKRAIKDFIVDFKQGDITKHTHDSDSGSCLIQADDDDDDILANNNYDNDNPIGNGRRKKKTRNKKPKSPEPLLTQDDLKFKQEVGLYEKTLLFLRTFAHNKDATPQDSIILLTASRQVLRVSNDFFCTYGFEEDDDAWCKRNFSLFINQHRSKVEEQLNYVCNNVSNLTIKQALLPLLADHFQTGTTPPPPSQIHHPHVQDKDGNLTSSSSSDMSSGEGSSKPLPEIHHHKCCCRPLGAEPEPIYKVEWEHKPRSEITNFMA